MHEVYQAWYAPIYVHLTIVDYNKYSAQLRSRWNLSIRNDKFHKVYK